MFATIIEHPILHPLKRVALGEHSLIVGQAHRPELHAETELTVPEARADDGIDTQAAAFRRLTEAANAVGWEGQPTAGERLDLGGDVKVLAENRLEAFSVAR